MKLVLINFKTYPETIGEKGIQLAKDLSKVKSKKYQIAIAPSLLNVKDVCDQIGRRKSKGNSKKTKSSKENINIYAQHADPITVGSHTGHISLKELKEMGVTGVILNHSERKRPYTIIKETVKICKKLHLKTIICVSYIFDIKDFSRLKPNYIAYEPKKLIGGNISVTNAKPKIIEKAVKVLNKKSSHIGLLVGAGVHSREDLRKAVQLGAGGVLIGHAVPKARYPKLFLRKMLD